MKMVYVLFAAAAAAAIGGVTSFGGSAPSSSPTPDASSLPADTQIAPTVAAEEDPGGVIEGDVLELINVPSYSYLRLGAKGTEGTWVAVSTASLQVGDHARVAGATKMPGFTSTTLKRTFAVIYFGALDGGHGAPGVPPAGGDAPSARALDPLNAQANPHESGADPHQGMNGRSAVEVKKVSRAAGPNGKTVAEILAQRVPLGGKTIHLQATVVKVTAGVLGRTYLHVQDGSGDAAKGTNDLSVTTAATPAVGQVVTIEGIVVLDREVGAGYTFPTLIENATIL